MIQWIGTVVAALLTLGALCSPSIAWAAWAKPSDLPGDVTQQCPEGREGQQAEGFRTRPSDLAPQIFTPAPTPHDLQARHLFDIAERCRAAGDHDKARTCYEEVHLLSPASPHGRLAIDRLWELDRARLNNNADADDAAEEQDAPPERERYREPTERRRGAEPSLRRLRKTIPPADDDARHREMLRSTQPLEPLPDIEAEAVDQDLWLPQSTIENIRSYVAWKKANSTKNSLVVPGEFVMPAQQTAAWDALTKYSQFIDEFAEQLQIKSPSAWYTPIVGTLQGVVENEPRVRTSRLPRLAAVQPEFRLLQAVSAWQAPEECLLVDRDLREQWRHDFSYLIPDGSSVFLPVRWFNENRTVQVITGSSNMISSLAFDTMMIIVMPTRVEFVQTPGSGRFDRFDMIPRCNY